MQNKFYFIGANLTCDLVIVNPEGKILVILRHEAADACPNQWALPGGFVDTLAKKGEAWLPNLETPDEAALRETAEEANLILPKGTVISPVGVYEGNQRDPRDNELAWSQSHAYFYQIEPAIYEAQKHQLRGLSDAKDVDWKTLDELEQSGMAFDHLKIIHDAFTMYMKPQIKKPVI